MQDVDDVELLRRYTAGGSEAAFAALVSRYVNLVYSVAMRHVGNSHQAQEITQVVFVILARKAHTLRQGTLLPGWLHKTAWFAADRLRKTEVRRKAREQEAYMQSLLNEPESDDWAQIAPLLDTALAGLSDTDRNAVVLRFFNGKKLSEVATALGTSEEAAKKRVGRAVEKLHHFFTQRGVVLPATVLTAAISAHSVQAAPIGLAATATGTVSSSSTLALIKATLNKMLWTKLKTSIVVGAAILLAAVTATGVVSTVRSSSIETAIRNTDSQSLENAPAVLVLRPSRYRTTTDRFALSGERYVGQNMGLPWLFGFAYDYPWWSCIVIPPDAPRDRYDLLLAVPGNPKEALRDAIKKQSGLVAHREKRLNGVLHLEIDPAVGSRIKRAHGDASSTQYVGWEAADTRRIALTNQPLSALTLSLEKHFGLPVFDHSGLNENYDLLLQWRGQQSANGEYAAIRAALGEQLGLKLVERKQEVEMLVVERVRQ